MLLLSRKEGEAIVLGNTIKVHVLDIENGRVKLGFEAPPDVVIVRSELLDNDRPFARIPQPQGSDHD